MHVRDMTAKAVQVRQKNAQARLEQVKRMKQEGMSGVEIASRLGVKYRTVIADFQKIRRGTNYE